MKIFVKLIAWFFIIFSVIIACECIANGNVKSSSSFSSSHSSSSESMIDEISSIREEVNSSFFSEYFSSSATPSYNTNSETESAYEIIDIVFVSRSGKIHDNSDCSGMKYYQCMEFSEAINRGYSLCQNCY